MLATWLANKRIVDRVVGIALIRLHGGDSISPPHTSYNFRNPSIIPEISDQDKDSQAALGLGCSYSYSLSMSGPYLHRIYFSYIL